MPAIKNKKHKKNSSKDNGVPKLKFNVGWEYAPAPESTAHIKLKDRYDLFIGGTFVKPSSGKYFETINPATEEKIAEVAEANSADVDKAVKAARQAYEKIWKKMPAAERGKYIFRISRMMQERAREFAVIESMDGGKAIRESRDVDVPLAANHFFYYAGWADKLEYAFPGRFPRSLGVAGQIIPWNFPLLMAAWKIAPAIAVGNTAIAKPSELTPMTAYLLGEICVESGLPNGVLNVVHGTGPNVGTAITAHPKITTISFTGGTATGKKVAEACAPLFKKVSLELGGKNPNIIFADADLDAAIAGSVRASFANQGQICLCGSRVFVERPIYNEFAGRFIDKTSQLKQGDPLDEKTEQGAIVNKAQLEKIKFYVDLAQKEGGKITLGGSSPKPSNDRTRDGYFFSPTVIVDLPVACRTNREEIFGPVVTITPFDNEDEVIRYANDVEYGLSSSVWTQNLSRAHRVAEQIHTGTVWVNCWLVRDLRVPFGGMKASGVGREGGEEALHFFTEPKNICIAK